MAFDLHRPGETAVTRRRLLGDPVDAPTEEHHHELPRGGMFTGGLGRARRGRLLTALLAVAVLLALGLALAGGSRDRIAGPQGAFPGEVAAAPALGRLPDVAGRAVVVGGLAVRAVGSRVDALRLADSTPYWTLVREDGPAVDDLARVDRSRVAVLWADGRLDLVDLHAGRVAWNSTVDGVSEAAKDATPGSRGALLAAGGDARPVLVAVTGTGLTALDPADGRTLWTRGRVDPVGGTAAGVVVRPQSSSVELLDARTGRVRWQHPLPAGSGELVAAGGDRVAFVGPAATTLLGAADGRVLGTLAGTGGGAPTGAAVADGAVYVLAGERLSRLGPGGQAAAAELPASAGARVGAADGVVAVTTAARTWLLRAG